MRTTIGGAVSAMGRGVRFLGATSRRPDSRAPGADRSQRDTMSNIWSKTVWIIMLAVIAGGAAAADPGGPAPGDPKLAGHFSGRVTGPNGQPLGGARVYITPIKSCISPVDPVRAETSADGRFDFDAPDMTFIDLDGLPARRDGLIVATADGCAPDWLHIWGRARSGFQSHSDPAKDAELNLRLAADDVPIRGRLLDDDAEPLAGARVRLVGLMVPLLRDLDAHLQREMRRNLAMCMPDYERSLYRPELAPGLTLETQTDADGQFTLSGLGRDRILQLTVSAPSVVDTPLTVMTRDAPGVGTGLTPGLTLPAIPTQIIHGAVFTLQFARGRTVSGLVRDRESRMPLAGMLVGIGRKNYPRDGVLSHQTITDARGRFTITGLDPSLAELNITAASAPGMPYLSAAAAVAADSPVVIECQRGIPFRLTLGDEQGRPVEAEVTYDNVTPNPQAPRGFCAPYRTPISHAARNKNGTYEGFAVPGPGAVLVKLPGRSDYRPAYVDPKAFFAPGRTEWTAQERLSAYGTRGMVSLSTGWADQNNYAAIVLVKPGPGSKRLELSATIAQDRPRSISLVDAEGRPVVGASTQGMSVYPYDYEPPLRAATFPLTQLHPDRVRRIIFTKEDRRLIGFLLARGDGDAPYIVQMRAWGTVTGRIVDENGNPLEVALSLGSPSDEANPDAEVGVHGGASTDAAGRFRIERLVPGQRYSAEVYRAHRLVGMAFDKLVLRAGQVRDVGDIRIGPLALAANSLPVPGAWIARRPVTRRPGPL
jgi:hypothetical protein